MSTPPAGTYRIDPVHTFAGFSTKHLLVGRVDGRFNSIEGTFDVTDDVERLFARIDVKIEAATIDTNVEARDDDLRGPRFFDAQNFPAVRYHGSATERTSAGRWAVEGELTIRELSRPVGFEIDLRGTTEDPKGNTRLGATARAALSRQDFDLTAEIRQETGNEPGPDVWVRLDIEAALQG
jgi:polyisoprenoid-binding protein YceI